MTRLLVLIILMNNLVGKLLTDKDALKISTYNMPVDFDIDQEIKEYCIVLENFHL